MAEKKLFLLDAMALIYRAHFAFSKSPRITSSGLNTSAVFGFTNSLWEVLSKEKPTHIGVCFDTPQATFRHEQFEAYKANRQEQPEDITTAIPLVKQVLQAMNIPVLELPGYEADDVAGTLAKIYGEKGYHVYLMTMDKDYCQLVTENVFLYKPNYMGKGYEVYDIPKVLEKFKIENVSQVIDILGLMGDAVDNIPGIPGIGEKTAQKLIAEYGSVEEIIANADKLKGKMQENVKNFAEQGLLSKELATIHCEVPITFNDEDLTYSEPDTVALEKLFDELEFRTLKARILGKTEAPKEAIKVNIGTDNGGQMNLFGGVTTTESSTQATEPTPKNTIETVNHHYKIIQSSEEIKALVNYMLQLEEVCFDTETTALEIKEAHIIGMSFAWVAHEAYYVPVPEDKVAAQVILEQFRPFFEHKNITKVGQNLKYDVGVLKNYQIEVVGPYFDTMIAHYLLNPDQRHGMDILSEHYLNYTPVSITTLIGKKGAKQGNMRDVAIEDIAEYAAEDADITWQLKAIFQEEIKKNNLEKLLNEVEHPLIPVLAEMEYQGVCLDTNALKEYSQQLAEEILTAEKFIYEQAGATFNIASPKQLGDILFEKLKLDPKAKKTKTKQYATGEEILEKLADKHPIVKEILNYRELQKLKSTYIDALPNLISPTDQRVHTSYNQTIAATGRLSSTNPNLQNIPIKTERGREIRKAFIASNEDYLIMSADYSQIELRIMAACSKEENMINAFKNNIDIHTNTAAKVYGVEVSEVTDDMRRKAKMVNFGIIYGISAFGLSQRLSIPRKEAGEMIDAYFEQFPQIKTYMDECINNAREQGYVETILGRKRYLPDINSANFTTRGFAERNAINAPIQGSAADMIKIAMIQIHEWLKTEKLKTKMIMQVHDELIFEVYKPELALIKEKVAQFMINAIPLEVPLEVGMGEGLNWLEAH